jgi:ABC-type transport system substrate-binding protein
VSTVPRTAARLVLAAPVLAFAALAAGCGGSSGDGAGAGAGPVSSTSVAAIGKATSVAASGSRPAPGQGGKLVWSSYLPSTWDPVTSQAGTDVTPLSLVYSALTHLDLNGNPVPELATRWAYSTDGLGLTFTLRPNLVFSDGTKLDATAVKENILRGRDFKASLIAPQLVSVADVQTPDPLTVKLVLKDKDYDLPRVLAGKTGEMVSPSAFTKNAGALATQPVGAGPFKLVKLTSGSAASLVRNPTYWNAGQILLSELDVLNAQNPQTVVASLKTGDINLAWVQAASTVAAIKATPGLKVDVVPSLRANSIEVNAAMKPFTDPRVTQAVNYAIDRTSLLKTIFAGIGEVTYQPFPKGYVGYSAAAANLYPYDPAKAKQLLAAAGYRSGGPAFTIDYFDSGSFKALAEALQAQLDAVGFKTKLAALPIAQAAQLVYVDHSIAFNPNGISGRESPLQMLNIQYAKDGLLNPCRCASADLTAALDAVGQVPTDGPQYPSLLQKATLTGAQQSANVFLTTQPWIYAYSSKVHGIQPYLVVERFEGTYVDK